MRKKLGELRETASQEISSKVTELKLELARERSINASGTKPENPGKIRKLRRNIAIMLTIMGEKTRRNSQAGLQTERKQEANA